MAIAFVGSGGAGGSANAASVGPLDIQGSNFIVLAIAYSGTLATGPSDGVNTYQALPARTSPDGGTIRIYYAEDADCSSPITVDVTGTNIFAAMAVYGFSGVKSSSSFDANNDGATASPATSLQSGGVTPAEDNELLFTGIVLGSVVTGLSINLGFAAAAHIVAVPATSFGLGTSYLIQTSAASSDPTFSWTTAVEAAMSIATFRSSGAAGPTPVLRGPVQSNLIWR